MLFRNILPFLVMLFAGIISILIVGTQLSPCIAFDPNTICRNFSAISLLLMTLAVLITGTGLLGLIGYLIRWRYYHHELFISHFNTALRQGFLLTLTTIISIAMLITNTFRWWTLILLLAFLLLIEFGIARRHRY